MKSNFKNTWMFNPLTSMVRVIDGKLQLELDGGLYTYVWADYNPFVSPQPTHLQVPKEGAAFGFQLAQYEQEAFEYMAIYRDFL